ncbi:hypothetical protein ACH5RR_039830 [Cinchona calisaya]|uniref:Uncharacterized protein n=1 Tax=Cinchona calisaya TaxID=153742 RepID=A0ABD2Y2R9_9GENT
MESGIVPAENEGLNGKVFGEEEGGAMHIVGMHAHAATLKSKEHVQEIRVMIHMVIRIHMGLILGTKKVVRGKLLFRSCVTDPPALRFASTPRVNGCHKISALYLAFCQFITPSPPTAAAPTSLSGVIPRIVISVGVQIGGFVRNCSSGDHGVSRHLDWTSSLTSLTFEKALPLGLVMLSARFSPDDRYSRQRVASEEEFWFAANSPKY